MGGVTSLSAGINGGSGGGGPISGFPARFLIVGGGGAGGSGSTGNGGGSGGGGGGIVDGEIYLQQGLTYSISVGTGGWRGTVAPNTVGKSGNNSTITQGTACTFYRTCIVARGGGGGSSQGVEGPCIGGSGGGGASSGAGTAGPGRIGAQPAQAQIYPNGSAHNNRGFNGGTGYGPRAGGGGGGGNQVGGNAPSGGVQPGGAGGNGYQWPYTANTYAGGGGGGADAGAGSGGTGGGGNGSNGAASNGAAGVINTGGGGGGTGQFPAAYGGGGGPGIVILGIPTPFYSAPKYPGAAVSTPGSAPGLTILSYTAPAVSGNGAYTFIP